ncbi:pyruvate, water dikinase regulatory protein [Staphylococcus schleiferi]|uniref:pyruvate, water dikinase regulatory protein n=1 Tax=Staphylococcus schleiferi TaxID=1295 RepID=UPI0024801964|nr:pyruvate, water dikinase regulatory protein [Staphylococcus schleiferi]
MEKRQLTIFIVSDSLGETAQRMVHAGVSQFPDLTQIEIKKFSFIKSEEELVHVLKLAKERDAIVVTTLVTEEYNVMGQAYANQYQIPYIDYMSSLLHHIQAQTGHIPTKETGMIRKLDDDYFKRIDAIEYSVKYDDGKHFTDIGEADALIVGVSRTSKTPLSMYLANKGYKIANIPLVPEVTIPYETIKKKQIKVFGLTASPQYIMNIRTERMKILGIDGQASYNDLKRIKVELAYAEEVFKKLNATVINTEYRSIEESAFYIEKFLQASF